VTWCRIHKLCSHSDDDDGDDDGCGHTDKDSLDAVAEVAEVDEHELIAELRLGHELVLLPLMILILMVLIVALTMTMMMMMMMALTHLMQLPSSRRSTSMNSSQNSDSAMNSFFFH
jgi:hypothetical protein